MPRKNLVALDADGVLLNYNHAYAATWHKAFGVKPIVKMRGAYHAKNEYDMSFPNEDAKKHFYDLFDHGGWSEMPALPHAKEGCELLKEAGYDLVVISSMPAHHADTRLQNLKDLGFPIEHVIATGSHPTQNPKLPYLLEVRPDVFLDDLLKNFRGAPPEMHCALLHWDTPDNPNTSDLKQLAHSSHANVLEFAQFWMNSYTTAMNM